MFPDGMRRRSCLLAARYLDLFYLPTESRFLHTSAAAGFSVYTAAVG